MKIQPRLNSRMDTPENQIKRTKSKEQMRKTQQCMLEGIEFTFRNEDLPRSPPSEIWPLLSSGGQVVMGELMSHSCLGKVLKV